MISIVTPTLNPGAALSECVESIQLQQTDVEHIIQDGGSTDGSTDELLKFTGRHRLRVYQENDSGIYDAVTLGIEKASGDVVGWLGADDCYTPWALATVRALFDARPDIQWIIGMPAWRCGQRRIVRTSSLAPVYSRRLLAAGWYRAGRLGFVQQESVFWRRALWDEVGASSWIRKYRLAGDYHLWRAFARITPLRSVASVFATFTLSESQASQRLADRYADEVGVNGMPLTRDASKSGRLFNRLLAIASHRKVLMPGQDFGQ